MSARSSILALALVAGIALCHAGSPPPPLWGGNNNTFAWYAVSNMTTYSKAGQAGPWSLVYYYDSTIGASRYDHDQGQEFVTCVGVAGQADGAACTVVNSNDGNMYINFPDTDYCCKCAPNFALADNWLQDGSSTFNGESKVGDFNAYTWCQDGLQRNCYTATADFFRTPLYYTTNNLTPNTKLVLNWDFLHVIQAAPPGGAAMFAKPTACAGGDVCQNAGCKFVRSMAGSSQARLF